MKTYGFGLALIIGVPGLLQFYVGSKTSKNFEYFTYAVNWLLICIGLGFLFICVGKNPGFQNVLPGRSIRVNGEILQLVLCKYCGLMRHPRTKHCKICEKCIERYEFHSGLLGKCIGNNNKAAYFGLSAVLSAQGVFLFIVCIKDLASAQSNMEFLIRALLIIYALLNFCCFTSNTLLQIYLISRNLTFRELTRRTSQFNPFDKTWQSNWEEFYNS